MNSAQWHQEIVVNNPVEELILSSNITSSSKTNNNLSSSVGGAEKKAAGTVVRPPKEQPIPCPRCNSINTKFCYYNNYSLTQPRYFCKGCRRYWTEGGSLRNIPVGGGSRKHKRSPTPAVTAPSGDQAAKKLFVHPSFQNPNNNTMIHHHQPERAGHDLNLSFPTHHQDDYRSISDFVHMPTTSSQAAATATGSFHLSALELLTGMTSGGSVGLGHGGGFSNTFMPLFEPDSVYSSASFSNFTQDFKPPTLNFSLNNKLGIAQSNSVGGFATTAHDDQISSTLGPGGGGLLPFDVMKNQQQADDHHHQNQTEESRGHGMSARFWTGMLGGGGGSDW